MSHPFSLNLGHKQELNLKQTQRLIMSPQMQQAIQLLQMPIMELTCAIETELKQNPILELVEGEGESPESFEESFEESVKMEAQEMSFEREFSAETELSFHESNLSHLKGLDEDFRDHFGANDIAEKKSKSDSELATYLESLVQSTPSLFEHLMKMAKESFDDDEMAIAEAIIGNLDERGFLTCSIEEIAAIEEIDLELAKVVLDEIQTFEPFGVGAKNLQECLLIQLRCLKKKKSLAYLIIDKHFDDMLHNRIPSIQKSLGVAAPSILETIEQTISKLDLRPGYQLSLQPTQYITPDVALRLEADGEMHIDIPHESLPRLRLSPYYLKLFDDPNIPLETKDYIKQKVLSGKWLVRSVQQRNETILRIVQVLLKKQRAFFKEPRGALIPLTMKSVAEELDLHESTVARAIAHKYIDCPKGLLPLRFFFTNSYTTEEGADISSNTVKKLLLEMVNKENKKKPLSDATLSDMFKEKGIICARRTIAKYRGELTIGSASQRRKYE